jgi:hypothetical protein
MEPSVPASPPIQLPDGVREMTEQVLTVLGVSLSREAATFTLFFVLFFLGVVIALVMRLNRDAPWHHLLLGSVPVALIASPSAAQVIAGGRLMANSNLLDRLVDWLNGDSPLSAAFFWFGAVILLGMLSWPVFKLLQRLAKLALKALESLASGFIKAGGGA